METEAPEQSRSKTETAGPKQRRSSWRTPSQSHEAKLAQQAKLAKRRATLEKIGEGLKMKNTQIPSEDRAIVAYRSNWELAYGKKYGCFEDNTVVPPMRYTFGAMPKYPALEQGLQIFSVEVVQLFEESGLNWPLHVYGMIAIRDSMDPRRNLMFYRTRDNCHTVTEKDPFLPLTGPSRAVVIIDPVSFEVQLKVKGETESEDKVLIFGVLTTLYPLIYSGCPPPICKSYLHGNRCKLGFAFALVSPSVEATISVEVVGGSWPEQFQGRIIASTASIPDGKVVLLDSGGAKMPFGGHAGVIMLLSRRVVSVELSGELKVEVEVPYFGEVIENYVSFTPKISNVSYRECDIFFCKLGVTVCWSVFTPS